MKKLLYQGAEAKILLDEKENLIIKDRISKSYRIKELDEKIIKHRTKSEKKLLEKASKIINAPNPLPLKEFNIIQMPYVQGKKLSEHLDSFQLEKQKEIMNIVGKETAKLHDNDIIHGDLTTSNMILVEDDNKFEKQIIELKSLNLPCDEYAVFGSGPLAVHGIRESKDIDIIVKPELWNKLIKKYSVKKADCGGNCFKVNKIEIYQDWRPWFDDVNKLINDADIFEGIKFVKLKYVLEWKKAYAREKDLKDVKLIEEYQKRGDINLPNFKVFFIDFGLGFISKKIEDKAVDIHLLKQALEAKHFKNWETLFNSFLEGYRKSKEAKQVLERLKVVELRGRYRH